MAKKVYVLTERDRDALQEALAEERRRPVSVPNRPSAEDWETETTPEVYVILTPADGIDAYAGGEVPSAECQVYRLARIDGVDALESVPGLTRRVYNTSGVGVAGSARGLGARDKFGQWYVLGAPCVFRAPPPAATGTGTAGLPGSLMMTATLCGCWTGDAVDANLVSGATDTYQTPAFPPSGCSGVGDLVFTVYRPVGSTDWYLLVNEGGVSVASAGPVTPTSEEPLVLEFANVGFSGASTMCPGGVIGVTFEEIP